MKVLPTLERELELARHGVTLVAGVDEAGRGPIAGPIVAAAVVLPPTPDPSLLACLRDSKALTPQARARAFDLLHACARCLGVGAASVEEIDTLGISEANRLAMLRAVAQLAPQPEHLLLDHVYGFRSSIPFTTLVDGDACCCSIAAASIVAKVTRDRLMEELDARYPSYGFARHKGYPTPQHKAALARLGPSPIHRRSFLPVRQMALPGMAATSGGGR